MKNIRTDLALEVRESLKQAAQQEIPGVETETDTNDPDIRITRVKIVSPEGVEQMGKPMGNYITLEVPGLRDNDEDLKEDVCRSLAKEINRLIGSQSKINLKENDTVLVVGLGNWNVTPDALGPRVISKLMVTRHLIEYVPDQVDEGVRPVCAIAPGVLGITGIETGEIIKGIVEKVKPNLVIAIDALASRKIERVSTTIQVADTGISPGSGIGNKRMGLSFQTLGVPVIAIGVPTVVDASTICNDIIELTVQELMNKSQKDSEFYKMLEGMNSDERNSLFNEVLEPYGGSLIVTPKEVDSIIEDISKIIANGINIGIHQSIDLKDVNRYLN
jgi:spore protease